MEGLRPRPRAKGRRGLRARRASPPSIGLPDRRPDPYPAGASLPEVESREATSGVGPGAGDASPRVVGDLRDGWAGRAASTRDRGWGREVDRGLGREPLSSLLLWRPRLPPSPATPSSTFVSLSSSPRPRFFSSPDLVWTAPPATWAVGAPRASSRSPAGRRAPTSRLRAGPGRLTPLVGPPGFGEGAGRKAAVLDPEARERRQTV